MAFPLSLHKKSLLLASQLGAIRTIESVHAESYSPAQYRNGLVTQPGLVIQIVAAPQPPRVLDYSAPMPAIEQTPEPEPFEAGRRS
jgi:hypothetical protein